MLWALQSRIEMQYEEMGGVLESIAQFIESEMTGKELQGIVSRLKNTIATVQVLSLLYCANVEVKN